MAKHDTSDPLLQRNEEYRKLLDKGTPRETTTPREHPGQQAPGNLGHDMPELARWTTDELRAHAAGLGMADAEHADREAVEAFIQRHDTTRARSGR